MRAWRANHQIAVCGGARWVCEDHTEKPWGGASDREDACHCGGPGCRDSGATHATMTIHRKCRRDTSL
jgi:hypothetical protein